MNRPTHFGAAATIALVMLTQLVDRPLAEEARSTSSRSDRALSLVIMDPLAAPLSCPCVEGYAQRKYEKLAEFLQDKLGRPVRVSFANALSEALKGDAKGRADLIIGKDSVVRADCREEKIRTVRLAALSDKQGLTTQTGLIVVAKHDPAQSAGDLAGYRILFGPSSCAEKHHAPLALLRKVGVELPAKLEMSAACSDGACKVVELGPDARSAAVISSYAAPLLEGCGTIEKGDLRVVAETEPVPFVAAFATSSLSKSEQQAAREVLLAVGDDQSLCKAIESLDGFVIPEDGDRPAAAAKKK